MDWCACQGIFTLTKLPFAKSNNSADRFWYISSTMDCWEYVMRKTTPATILRARIENILGQVLDVPHNFEVREKIWMCCVFLGFQCACCSHYYLDKLLLKRGLREYCHKCFAVNNKIRASIACFPIFFPFWIMQTGDFLERLPREQIIGRISTQHWVNSISFHIIYGG